MKNKPKKMYFPALLIAAIVLLLLLFIGVSTYRNFNRDRNTIRSFLDRQGNGLFKSIEAAFTSDSYSSNKDIAVNSLLKKISELDDVYYIYVTNPEGRIISKTGEVPDSGIVKLKDFGNTYSAVLKEIKHYPEDLDIYEMSRLFFPAGFNIPRDSENRGGKYLTGVPFKIVTLGLHMADYEASLKTDMHHAVIMAAILLVLGSGLVFFIFVIQNYYLVDKNLKQAQDYTRQVIENMANGLISIDNEGKIVSYNNLALEMLDIREKEAVGMDLRELIDFNSSGISNALNNRESTLEREINLFKKQGALPMSISVAPIHMDSGQVNGAVIILRDLRELKKLQEKVKRSEKLAAIGKLAAGVAHEIRNPLSSIKGFAQFLRHVLRDRPDDREYATVMVHEIDRINRVVSDLLIYSKPFEVRPKKQDLEKLLDHTIMLVKADAGAKKTDIVKKMSERMSELWLDPNQITHALLNLLLNSLDAVSEGGRIEMGAELVDKEHVHIWVEDDGPGIPAEYQEKVMDPFYTTRDKGTGLGLAIVHKILENHNGDIQITSPLPGKSTGTRISMYIPLSMDVIEEET